MTKPRKLVPANSISSHALNRREHRWAVAFLLYIYALAAGHAYPQAATPTALQFEAVSIKANHSGKDRGVLEIAPSGDRVVVRNSPMFRILAFAFDRQRSDLIVGLPDWTRNERWDIEATISAADVPAFQALSFRQKRPCFSTS